MAMRRLASGLEAELIDVARELADVARAATVDLFRSSAMSTENKASDGWDPVTAADRNAELAMREVVAKRRPDDGVFGEEFESFAGTTGLSWVLDPIDGTRSFVSGAPVWGVLICVSDQDGPLYGIIEQPYIGERFEGGFGAAMMRGPRGYRRLQVRSTARVEDSILFTTLPEIGSEAERLAFERLSGMTLLTRYGLDCYGYALVALGQIDLVVEAGLKPFDIHAPIAVVRAAGGVVTDWAGGPAHKADRIVAAATAELHATALQALDWRG